MMQSPPTRTNILTREGGFRLRVRRFQPHAIPAPHYQPKPLSNSALATPKASLTLLASRPPA
jgi:hypothetical protein